MPSRLTLALVGALVALLAGAFAWQYGGSTAAVDTSTRQGQDLVRGWRQVGPVPLPAVSRTLPGISGAPDGLPERGTYLVNLWASTCAPCRREMPWLERLHDEAGVTVIGVTRDNLLSEATRFLQRRDLTYPNLRDEFGDFMHALGDVVPASVLPSSFIVRDGSIVWVRVGSFDSYADLHQTVTARL